MPTGNHPYKSTLYRKGAEDYGFSASQPCNGKDLVSWATRDVSVATQKRLPPKAAAGEILLGKQSVSIEPFDLASYE